MGTYIYLNPKTPEPSISGEFITTLDLNSFCRLQEEKTCNIPMPCEGEKVDIIGYNVRYQNELRGLVGSGMAQTTIQIVFFDENVPKDSKEYMEVMNNNFWTGVTIIEAKETGDSSISAKALNEKLDALKVDNSEPIIVKVKNARIVGYNKPTNDDCTRGITLEASYNDITFEKIN